MRHLGEGRRAWAATIQAVVQYHATEGRSWGHWLDADGSRLARLTEAETAQGADASVVASIEGAAGDLVLAFYDRTSWDSLKVDDPRGVFDQLVEWDPEP